MLTLSIDTASNYCGAALWQGDRSNGKLVCMHEDMMVRGHAEMLFTTIHKVLSAADISPQEINRFAAVQGPGNFTGLRVGLSAVRGLALASSGNALAINTFELLAAADERETGEKVQRIAVLNARRGLHEVAIVGTNLLISGQPSLCSPDELAKFVRHDRTLMIGPGATEVATTIINLDLELTARMPPRPTAALLAELASTRDPMDTPAEPLYIRPPDAKLPTTPSLRANSSNDTM